MTIFSPDFHNETINIHSHLWGAVLFLVLLVITFYETLSYHPTVTWHDVAGFVVFLAAAVICLSFSAMFHTGSCHSYKVRGTFYCPRKVGVNVVAQVAKSCVVLDYSGIVGTSASSMT